MRLASFFKLDVALGEFQKTILHGRVFEVFEHSLFDLAVQVVEPHVNTVQIETTVRRVRAHSKHFLVERSELYEAPLA